MFNVCKNNQKTMDTYFIFIVVFGFLCTIGSAHYFVQPIPGTEKNAQEMLTETVIVPKPNASDKASINKNSNVAISTAVQAPSIFPKENSSLFHFVKNETIQDALLSHTSNHTVENATSITAPKSFPTDSNKYKFLKNNTILAHLINATEHQNVTQNESTTNSTPLYIPPKVFPTDTTKYKFKSNQTILDTFLSKNPNHVDTEIPDLLSKKHYEGEYDVDQIDPNLTTTAKTVIINSVVNNTRLFTTQSETDQVMENGSIVDKHFGHDHLTNGKSQVAHGPLAGILIGVLLLVALVGYASLVLWRRSLEIKYGTRERLVNEDDFDPHYDNRFEL
ncbi:uncharacterized protein LOC123302878 [Chrysoperla carnea]|uniref:uncharacterized protein LOC123302878 n=1 Tax=Chrysoperla carnea TaxID=189513 RepID=UPI001D097A70|nr:uncharacterized protein LOC123302878 [Chrysoperla carnea]